MDEPEYKERYKGFLLPMLGVPKSSKRRCPDGGQIHIRFDSDLKEKEDRSPLR